MLATRPQVFASLLSFAALAALLLPLPAAGADPPLPFCGESFPEQRITSPDSVSPDGFATSVVASGTRLFVGVPGDDGVGSVYVCLEDTGAYILEQRITPSVPGPGDRFGAALSVSDSGILAVGAPGGAGPGGDEQGYVEHWARSGNTWSLQSKIQSAVGAANDHFGWSVAMHGPITAVGIPGADGTSETDRGRAEIWSSEGGPFVRQHFIDGEHAGDQLGLAVAAGLGSSGFEVAIGAPFEDLPAFPDTGSFQVWVRPSGSWGLEQKSFDPLPSVGSLGGTSLALDGDHLAVGFPSHACGAGSGCGTVEVWTRTTGSWAMDEEIASTTPAAGDNFGIAVALEGGLLAVGADRDDGASTIDQGNVEVFRSFGTGWEFHYRFVAPDGASNDLYGHSVDLDDVLLAVGAPGRTSATGAAYVAAAMVWHAYDANLNCLIEFPEYAQTRAALLQGGASFQDYTQSRSALLMGVEYDNLFPAYRC